MDLFYIKFNSSSAIMKKTMSKKKDAKPQHYLILRQLEVGQIVVSLHRIPSKDANLQLIVLTLIMPMLLLLIQLVAILLHMIN